MSSVARIVDVEISDCCSSNHLVRAEIRGENRCRFLSPQSFDHDRFPFKQVNLTNGNFDVCALRNLSGQQPCAFGIRKEIRTHASTGFVISPFISFKAKHARHLDGAIKPNSIGFSAKFRFPESLVVGAYLNVVLILIVLSRGACGKKERYGD